MLETESFGEVACIRVSRELDGQPVYWTAAYLVDGLLIDAGCAHTSRELAEYLEGERVRILVNTHHHEDHCGGNRDVMERFGVPLYAHRDSIPIIGQKPFLYPFQEIAWGYPKPTVAQPLPERIKTDRHSFEIIETPGHCEGHVCLVEISEGWCFSGDIFAREQIKFMRPEEDIGQTLASMRSLLELPCRELTLFTGLGRVVREGRKALSSCIEGMTELALMVQGMAERGASIDEIVESVFGGEHIFFQITDNQYSTANLVRSLLLMDSRVYSVY